MGHGRQTRLGCLKQRYDIYIRWCLFSVPTFVGYVHPWAVEGIIKTDDNIFDTCGEIVGEGKFINLHISLSHHFHIPDMQKRQKHPLPAMALAIILAGLIATACSSIVAMPGGKDVSNRCSLTDRMTIASWETGADGFTAGADSAVIALADSLTVPYEGTRCLEVIFPGGREASCPRSVGKSFNPPLDLSGKGLVEYGLLVSEGPGRDFTTTLTLRSSEGEEFISTAHIIPTLWQGVIFDIQSCPFTEDVASIKISVSNDSSEPWENPRFMIDGLTAGKPLDLDFDIDGSADRFVAHGDAEVKQGEDMAIIDFKNGGAVELSTSGSRNAIYNPNLEWRNTVALAIENRSDADTLCLSFVTDRDSTFTPGKSKKTVISKDEGWQYVEFNLSDIPGAEGRLEGLRIEAVGGEGTIMIDRISFEREAPIGINAGEIISCTASEDGNLTVKGIVKEEYLSEGARIEVRHAPHWKSDVPFDSLEPVGECPAGSEFEICDIPNERLGGRMTHLSSRFRAALRMKGGRILAIGEPFFITNWQDFIENPYRFETSEKEYPVEDFGAKGDGVTNDNAAIQRAIDKASSAGGGRVVLRGNAGNTGERTYIATNLELRKGVNLVIQQGAVLRQSPKFAHYSEYPPEYGHDNVIPGVPWTHCMYTNRPLILAKDTENVKITGGGKIRMDDTYSENPAWTHYARTCSDRIHIVPIAVCNTRHVEISDIDIVRCSNYHTIFYRADSVFIGNLKMQEVACLSGDGLSLGNAVTNVRVARCVFESNDDGIVLCSSYKDPRGGVWRERVDSIDSSVRHIEVFGSYIDCARGGGGKAIALIPWGSTNPRQDYNEIDDIEVRDCVLRGGHSVGSWPDNPFDGKPFDNSEPDDYAPVKNLRIFDNEYLSPLELNGVVPVTLLTDCGLKGSRQFKNPAFADRLAYWSTTGVADGREQGRVRLADGLIYQGLYLPAGRYSLSWTGEGEISPCLSDIEGRALEVGEDGVFDVPQAATFLLGVRGKNAVITSVALKKIK